MKTISEVVADIPGAKGVLNIGCKVRLLSGQAKSSQLQVLHL